MDGTGRDLLAAEGHKDRRVGLVVFGALEIVSGFLLALMVPLTIASQLLSARVTGAPPMWGSAFISIATYGFLAAALVWVGIGSIRRRRWACSLSLVLGWSWLLMGVLSVGMMVVVFALMSGTTLPSSPSTLVILLVVLAIAAVPLLVVPTALVVFYSSRHVRATCEAHDTAASWTDACPLPVLATSLWMAFGGVIMFPFALSGEAAMPFFGVLLGGAPGALVTLLLAALWIYLAWALYRLRLSAWWATLGFFVVLGLSSVTTFLRVDPLDLYRQMGYPEQQIAVLRGIPFFSGPVFAAYLAVLFAGMIAFMLWIRKHFTTPGAA